MIAAVTIKNLRGTREGTLEGLTPLVVLVGPNSSGKSTVLDALLIGASSRPAEGLRQALQRRKEGPRWLFWRAGDGGPAVVDVTTSAKIERRCAFELQQPGPPQGTSIVGTISTGGSNDPHPLRLDFQGNGTWYDYQPAPPPLPDVPEARLVEPKGGSHPAPLPEVYSRAVERGRRAEVTAMLTELVPGLTGIEILIEDGAPVVHLVYADHSVPVGLAGDGIQSLLRMVLELAARPRGLVLIEEPEMHQHPAALRQTARAILVAVRRGIQVVLSTHSLELIDALLAELKDDELGLLSLYRLKLDGGVLRSSRLAGASVLHSRGEIGDDLR